MGSTAIIFTGQGSQFVGMGQELSASAPAARQVFEEAEYIIPGITDICFHGPDELLNETSHTQPAIFTTEIALWHAFKEKWSEYFNEITCMAGHSLGEYAALVASNALTFPEGLRLVLARGQAMRDAGIRAPGGMMVVLGLDDKAVADLVADQQADGVLVWVANLNAPGQVVLAGTRDALTKAQAAAIAKGAKRCIPLSVSVACHTPLMREASDKLASALRETTICTPWVPIVCNADARPITAPALIKDALLRQLVSPVRWVESVEAIRASGTTKIVEIGPKAVLAGLVQRIDRNLAVHSVSDTATLNSLVWEA